jgi:hypothetical protein
LRRPAKSATIPVIVSTDRQRNPPGRQRRHHTNQQTGMLPGFRRAGPTHGFAWTGITGGQPSQGRLRAVREPVLSIVQTRFHVWRIAPLLKTQIYHPIEINRIAPSGRVGIAFCAKKMESFHFLIPGLLQHICH